MCIENHNKYMLPPRSWGLKFVFRSGIRDLFKLQTLARDQLFSLNLEIMLTEQYAPGIPLRVTEYADSVKQKFEGNANQSHIHPRAGTDAELPVLPPGISREDFNNAIEELRPLVDGFVELVDGDLDDGWYLHRPLTHDVYALDQEAYFVNSAVCSPGSVEQVQSVVRWANQWLIPIYAVSMGRNFGMLCSWI